MTPNRLADTLRSYYLVGSQIFLSMWTSNSIPSFSNGSYMGTYAGLGIVIGLTSYVAAVNMNLRSLAASQRLFSDALEAMFRARIAWFDVVSLGNN